MSFRLLGISVEVQIGFWLTAVLLQVGLLQRQQFRFLLVWVAVVFISVLIHEFGHALAIKRHRVEPEITLHWLGGTTNWRTPLPLGRLDHVIISLAGPFAGFSLGVPLYFAFKY